MKRKQWEKGGKRFGGNRTESLYLLADEESFAANVLLILA